MINRISIIIPSWMQLDTVMQAETGVRFPAFIQLAGKPLYFHILKSYEAIKDRADFYLILPPDAPSVSLKHLDGYNLIVLRLKYSQSIGNTVAHALKSILIPGALVIHMSDTLIAGLQIEEQSDRVYVQMRSDLHRWTVLQKNNNGNVFVLTDRELHTKPTEQYVSVGVYQFSDFNLFRELLEINLKSIHTGKNDPLFTTIENYSEHHAINFQIPDVWNDCGHLDTYYQARLNFHNLRHFNHLAYDGENGIVTKRSENQDAFRHQVRWYRQVPDELKFFLPRIFSDSDGNDPFITMELLSIPSLSDLYISQRLELGAWNNVGKKINSIYEIFRKFNVKSFAGEQIAAEIYINKTMNRLVAFVEQRPEVINYWVHSGDKKLNIMSIISLIKSYAHKNELLNMEYLTPIHGDFCFSNIMYDPRGGHIKLIDPRGEFGVPGIYGDPLYDKAKLLHSFDGGYDLIVSDHFEVSVSEEGNIIYKPEFTDYHHKVKNILQSSLFKDEIEMNRCSAIEALLFLSMLPLHNDKPQRQLAMLHTGLTLFSKHSYGLTL